MPRKDSQGRWTHAPSLGRRRSDAPGERFWVHLWPSDSHAGVGFSEQRHVVLCWAAPVELLPPGVLVALDLGPALIERASLVKNAVHDRVETAAVDV